MQEFKVGDLVEVIKNTSCAMKNKNEYYKKGDVDVVTWVGNEYINLGNNVPHNTINKKQIKKVEQSPELTEYEEVLVLRLAEKIKGNNMQEFKVGDLVEVLENNSYAYNNKFNLFEKGDIAIVKEVFSNDVRIGENGYANFISKNEIKKVEPTPELTEYEEEIVLRLSEKIKQKDEYIKELEYLDSKVKDIEILLEDKQKEIDFEVKKLLTK